VKEYLVLATTGSGYGSGYDSGYGSVDSSFAYVALQSPAVGASTAL
jgi:hypothetical protein